ncbi:hypothetical protein AKJ37_01635 [candidate division MSBL1 archaeon SCGC-AAA259I09]|uniref:Uncharacterized protein n=1 Tax=candidate division MSBL1 archaeon SCGC-AAA259I09 TaxID=1698267 RepID=A0A133UV03_9EURY|nr:hypothetical protein AKJ37_01635 [candidate division MSBL1 archaeon SCGC-AAA259I09]
MIDLSKNNSHISSLRVVSKREEDSYAVRIPIKEDKFSLVLPEGYIKWPEGKPYPDPVRIKIDDERNLWLNFGVSKKHGFYASLKIDENGEQ